jgi:putative N6-adenine-specific DNA methylase
VQRGGYQRDGERAGERNRDDDGDSSRGFERAQSEELGAEFFQAFGDALKQRFTGWHAFMLSSDRGLPGQLRLRESTKTPLFNGALECRLFRFDLIAGSVRRREPEA